MAFPSVYMLLWKRTRDGGADTVETDRQMATVVIFAKSDGKRKSNFSAV